jgi:hypothetical protein
MSVWGLQQVIKQLNLTMIMENLIFTRHMSGKTRKTNLVARRIAKIHAAPGFHTPRMPRYCNQLLLDRS